LLSTIGKVTLRVANSLISVDGSSGGDRLATVTGLIVAVAGPFGAVRVPLELRNAIATSATKGEPG